MKFIERIFGWDSTVVTQPYSEWLYAKVRAGWHLVGQAGTRRTKDGHVLLLYKFRRPSRR